MHAHNPPLPTTPLPTIPLSNPHSRPGSHAFRLCFDPSLEPMQVSTEHLPDTMPSTQCISTSLEALDSLALDQLHSEALAPCDQSVVPSSHPMVTRAEASIFRPRYPTYLSHHVSSLLHALFTTPEPRGFKSTSKNPTWLAVMDDKIQALYDNCTWDLILWPPQKNIMGSKWVFRTNFIRQLHSEFATKDLGSFSYFLGLEVTSTSVGLFLNQTKYAHDILARAQLLDCKLVTAPMVVAHHLSSDGSPFTDVTLYRSLVGALQYLTITRPNLTHSYVKGTLHFGLSFNVSSSTSITAYFDIDWAGCPDTRRSTLGYSIYLGDNLVSWSAKKQPTVCRSSCESEYRALASTAAEMSLPRVFQGHSSRSFDPSYVCALIPRLACGGC
ncbi:hypothetical protein Acr_00g0005400 [Actinidia rufa]|uniref:Reverse transcriptase Ty1/copia-type domain-containing protein n=1 Tax=Actinidia rufa TaxID=165716 RepID=A0A7J0D7Q8_9ERIC|nr:hypothetical protein Acr_00g0005400 [Actinidia rufa]